MENTNDLRSARKIQLEAIYRCLPPDIPAPEEADIAYPEIGTIIYNYFYARITGNTSFEAKADELLDTVLEEANRSMPLHLEKGLCGLGCGLIYMVRNGLIEGDENKILEDIDWIVNRSIIQPENAKNCYWKGIYGWIYYLRMRISGNSASPESLTILLLKQDLLSLIDQVYRKRGIHVSDIEEIKEELKKVHQMKIFPFKTGKLIEYYSSISSPADS